MTSVPEGFETLTEVVRVGNLVFSVTHPVSADDLIDEDEYEVDERLPYWADLWPSGRVLADALAPLALADRSVLELGAGLGLPSLVAAARGARVIATDWYEPAVGFIRANAEAAGLALDTAVVDWRDPPAAVLDRAPFDLVIAADVLYEARNAAPLVALVQRVLAPRGEALIADPRRPDARAFLDAMRAAGWSLETTDVPSARPDESGPVIHLHRLRPPGVEPQRVPSDTLDARDPR